MFRCPECGYSKLWIIDDAHGFGYYCPSCGCSKCPQCKTEGGNIRFEEDIGLEGINLGLQPYCLSCGWRPTKKVSEEILREQREDTRARKRCPSHAGKRLN